MFDAGILFESLLPVLDARLDNCNGPIWICSQCLYKNLKTISKEFVCTDLILLCDWKKNKQSLVLTISHMAEVSYIFLLLKILIFIIFN